MLLNRTKHYLQVQRCFIKSSHKIASKLLMVQNAMKTMFLWNKKLPCHNAVIIKAACLFGC